MPVLSRILITIGSLSLVSAFMLSAYGFHGLDLSPEKQASWGWAVELQSYNSLGLVLLGLLAARLERPFLLGIAGALITAGLFLFSGSIYVETLGAPPAVGQVAPLGGGSFMFAWFLVAVSVWVHRAR